MPIDQHCSSVKGRVSDKGLGYLHSLIQTNLVYFLSFCLTFDEFLEWYMLDIFFNLYRGHGIIIRTTKLHFQKVIIEFLLLDTYVFLTTVRFYLLFLYLQIWRVPIWRVLSDQHLLKKERNIYVTTIKFSSHIDNNNSGKTSQDWGSFFAGHIDDIDFGKNISRLRFLW